MLLKFPMPMFLEQKNPGKNVRSSSGGRGGGRSRDLGQVARTIGGQEERVHSLPSGQQAATHLFFTQVGQTYATTILIQVSNSNIT
jgi:hypothetical protein